ncbi:MAG: hypothetical protein JNM90_24690, partial [Burkholderiales bacterium]|nr:hypothetical protein [Burkholderiales bacterium]
PRPHAAAALWIALVVLAVAAVLGWHGPIHQPPRYHDFADTRAWLGIPNAADVLSNLPFLAAGMFGLAAALRLPAQVPSRAAWGMFFAAVALTTAGSAFYHWAPDTIGLAVDRAPIAWACAWLTLALLAERVDARCGRPAMQALAFVAATASVGLWLRGELTGTGDLRAYLFVQFLPVLLIPLVCGLTRGGVLGAWDWHGAIALYLVAKALEVADAPIFASTGVASGHTLKHLVAALAALWLAQRLAQRGAALRADARQANRT